MKPRALACLFLLSCAAVGRLSAGSVITTNLPSNVEILNINAQQDGAAVHP